MQVTDTMVEAAFEAYGKSQNAAGGMFWCLKRQFLRDAIQAALEATPERDDAEPPPFVVALSEERLRLFPAGVADAVRKLLGSRAVWRNLARRQGAELEQLRAERDARGHDLRVPVRLHVQVDEEAFAASVVAAVKALPAALPRDDQGRISIATLDDDLAPAAGGLVADTPEALGSFIEPLRNDVSLMRLLSAGQIAGHLGVGLEQVMEWIDLGPAIRFPAPLKRSIAGDRWQLGVIDQWYGLWKASNGG